MWEDQLLGDDQRLVERLAERLPEELEVVLALPEDEAREWVPRLGAVPWTLGADLYPRDVGLVERCARRVDLAIDRNAGYYPLSVRHSLREGFNRDEIDSFYVAPPGQNAMNPLGGDAPHASAGSRFAGFGAIAGAIVGGLLGMLIGFAIDSRYGAVAVLFAAGLGAYVGSFLGAMGPDEYLFRLTAANEKSDDHLLKDHFALTTRESEVLLWIAKGKSNRDIGDILGLSARTVNKHLEQIYVKLGVENRASAAVKAAHVLHQG